MANAREILNRMHSVQDTRKITNAMYLIASTKLKQKIPGRDGAVLLYASESDPENSQTYAGCEAFLF